MTDEFKQGECPFCGWWNSHLNEENENCVIFPNVISLNKAKILYSKGLPFSPSIEDFIDMLYFYGETTLIYKGESYSFFLTNDQIEMGSEKTLHYFKDKADFIQNAKIGNEYVRDIWDKVENPSYM